MPWVEEELKEIALEDRRLNERLVTTLNLLTKKSNMSIAAACTNNAETKAAYRLFANPKVTFDAVLEPHVDKSRDRISDHPVVLLVQDTTEIELTRPNKQMEGVGY